MHASGQEQPRKKKCWFNSLMVILNVFNPFLEPLNLARQEGKLSTGSKKAFQQRLNNPALMKNDSQVIDTTKTMGDFKTAIQAT
jgi:hypothetical protein